MPYKHTQVGYVILISLFVTCVFTLAVCLVVDAVVPGLLTAAVLFVWEVLFGWMTIEISGGRLKWSFGPGLIRKSAPLDQIANARLWRMPFIGGWGIHWTREGWLYNVSGMRGVAITLKNGKSFVLGSDEPEQLIAAVEYALTFRSS